MIRRVVGNILFVLGGWMLTSGLVAGWIDFGVGAAGPWFALAMMTAFAAPFLGLGTWVSPGDRRAELGLTLMICASVGGGVILTWAVMFADPAFRQLMPPGQTPPDVRLAPVSGLAGLLIVGGGGYGLRRGATRRAGAPSPGP